MGVKNEGAQARLNFARPTRHGEDPDGRQNPGSNLNLLAAFHSADFEVEARDGNYDCDQGNGQTFSTVVTLL